MTDEEQRAADYRAEQIARAAADAVRRANLHGSATARAALAARWEPRTGIPLVFDLPDLRCLPGPETN